MSNDIDELRGALFETLRSLKAGEIDTERARAINETAQTIINTAKVEVDYIRQAGGTSAFIGGTALPAIGAPDGHAPVTMLLPPGQSRTIQTKGGTKVVTQVSEGVTVTQHRMAG